MKGWRQERRYIEDNITLIEASRGKVAQSREENKGKTDGDLRTKMIKDIYGQINDPNNIQEIQKTVKRYIYDNETFLDKNFGYIKKNGLNLYNWIMNLEQGYIKNKDRFTEKERDKSK